MPQTSDPTEAGLDFETAYARSVLGGKRTDRIEARVTDEMKLDLRRRCNTLGMTESDYIERLVAVSLYGLDHVQMVEQERIRQVCGLSGLVPPKA